ncbi:hypothetical protein [Bradyrhizobium sp. SZCCHNRI1058]|uniref:hypothetical protein n=1 Tax=Bradyrhizobium sp. SZCCHNRI1058 TaxID=3057279 RepID=UPI00291709B5|nr:hypothetical protein [Bradyrhizobium sp. SZCCHNRI1058]
MAEQRRTIRVFFSWQSDLPQGPTTRAVRAALRAASSEVESKHPVDLVLEEATSNTPGSPYIPYELAEKIRKSDIFVADITAVVRIGEENSRKSLPNANVTFELGVASAQVGWSRIIMLFNAELAEMKDLPFDFDRHRISTFKMKEGQEKAGASALRGLVVEALSRIIVDNPKRPRELEGSSDEEIKRSRDIENIRWFMRHINTGFLDQHIQDMPTYLNWSAAFIFDGIDSIIRSSDFLLYDQDVYAAMKGLYDSLAETLRYEGHYRDTSNPKKQIFGTNRMDMATRSDEEKAIEAIDKARAELQRYLTELITLLRERYLEIDIDATNRRCAKMLADTEV